MAADIQRVRWALAKVEEKLNENPNLSVGSTVMKQLLDLYKDCKGIDQLINTRHFDEEHFGGLVEKVKARSGRLGNAQTAMAEHVSRMFSEENGHASDKTSGKTDGESKAAAVSANEAAVAWQKAEGERAEKDDRDICLKMLSLMKGQLLKCHEDLTQRLGAAGGQNAIFSPEDLAESNEEASYDLEGIMSSILGATRQHIQRQLVALFSPLTEFATLSSVDVAVEPPTQNGDASTSNNDSTMDVDGTAPSGVTSEDISKALYGSPRESKDRNDDDKEKAEEPRGDTEAVAGPSSADVNKGYNKDEDEGKSICGRGPSFWLSVCPPQQTRLPLPRLMNRELDGLFLIKMNHCPQHSVRHFRWHRPPRTLIGTSCRSFNRATRRPSSNLCGRRSIC